MFHACENVYFIFSLSFLQQIPIWYTKFWQVEKSLVLSLKENLYQIKVNNNKIKLIKSTTTRYLLAKVGNREI